jgi:hypothetical protein
LYKWLEEAYVVQYRRRLVVPQTVAEVFDYLSRFSSAAEWDPGVSAARMVTPEPVRLGSVFALQASFLGRTLPLSYEIIEFQPSDLVRLRAENDSVRSTDRIRLSQHTGGGTEIDYLAELELLGASKLATPIFALAFRRLGDHAADGLVRTLTAKAGQPPVAGR